MALGATGCITVDLLSGGANAPLRESTVEGDAGPKVLLVEIDGVISGEPSSSGLFDREAPSMVARVREALDRAREDDEVRGLLLRIDSPGGTATGSEQIYSEIVRFKEERGAPVVAQMLQLAASGGYYVAMSADTVQAHPTSVLGSIGVIFGGVNVAGLMDKLGIENQTITGGELKDMGSPLRPLTTEERAQLQAIVDDLHARFREVVVRGRPALGPERVDALADGRVYSAPQALENGLVDRIGNLNDAIALLEKEIGVPEVRVVSYHRPNQRRRNVYMKSATPAPAASGAPLPAALGAMLEQPGFHYLWWPGLSSLR